MLESTSMYDGYPKYLECQDCGCVLKILNTQETQQIVQSPYNYVVYCNDCRKERWKCDPYSPSIQAG